MSLPEFMRVAGAFALAFGIALCSATTVCAQGAMQGLPVKMTPAPTQNLGAHARFSRAPIDLNPPDLGLTAAVLAAGGGAPAFTADTFVGNLVGNGDPTRTELAALTKRFGAPTVATFRKTFRFFVSDSLEQFGTFGMALPTAPTTNPNDSRALATALYGAGTLPNGKYDDEYMLDGLVSHVVNVAVMNDIDASPDFGPAADADYHRVLFALMEDVKKMDGLAASAPRARRPAAERCLNRTRTVDGEAHCDKWLRSSLS